MDKTPCECPLAGFCQRHGVEKSSHLHKLCQNHIGYYNLWEQCRGPKQNPSDCTKASIPEKVELPSTMEMAKNLAVSTAKHVANGMQNITPEKQKERLDICSTCPFLVEDGSRCAKCGCFLEVKTKWASSSCPIGKW